MNWLDPLVSVLIGALISSLVAESALEGIEARRQALERESKAEESAVADEQSAAAKDEDSAEGAAAEESGEVEANAVGTNV
jgi:hypothetical protein